MIRAKRVASKGWTNPVALCGVVLLSLVACVRSAPKVLSLSDGTRIYYKYDSTITASATFAVPREVLIDGEAFVEVRSTPFVIRTRLMHLTVSEKSDMRVIAHSNEPGEQVDVVTGMVTATKAYPSEHNDPDTLTDGDAVMVNQVIDLQEKDASDVQQVEAWRMAITANAKPQVCDR